MPGGRPSIYTDEIADEICETVATNSRGVEHFCTQEHWPAARTIYAWIDSRPEFAQKYARAKERQAELMANEILEIADDGTNDSYVDDNGNSKTDWDVLGRSRLRVDTRKWLMSKLLPKKYGDKIQQEISGKDGAAPPIINLTISDVTRDKS
jgi:hypothetical protein